MLPQKVVTFFFFVRQICLLGKSNEKEGIPSYDDIFGNDDEDGVQIYF